MLCETLAITCNFPTAYKRRDFLALTFLKNIIMATTMLARTLASISQRSVIPRVVTGVRQYCEKPIPFYDPAAGKEGKLSGNYHVYKSRHFCKSFFF